MNERNENEKLSIREVLSFPAPELGFGKYLLKIPVADNNINHVIVESDVWYELLALGLNPKLDIGRTTGNVIDVWCAKPRRYYPLKRFVMDVTTEDEVRCLDGNEFNLRRSNLVVDRPPPKPVETYRDMLDPSYGRTASVLQYRLVTDAKL